MSDGSRRIQREKRTVSIMIEMYCRARHDGHLGGLCHGCARLHDYAMERIEKCPFCLAKPTCANCPIHCYKPDMRERVRKVMRYSGPRMLKRHPVLALLHKLGGLRKVEAPRRKTSPSGS
ncbi:MAG: nitrous oxide-stimulated promoter family protein [Planctomycetota bacterium]|jgi:hypothetical protein